MLTAYQCQKRSEPWFLVDTLLRLVCNLKLQSEYLPVKFLHNHFAVKQFCTKQLRSKNIKEQQPAHSCEKQHETIFHTIHRLNEINSADAINSSISTQRTADDAVRILAPKPQRKALKLSLQRTDYKNVL